MLRPDLSVCETPPHLRAHPLTFAMPLLFWARDHQIDSPPETIKLA